MERYAAYKDSGVEWIGEIPAGWEVKKLKYVAYFQRGHDLSSTNFHEGDIPVYGSNGIIGYHNKFTTTGPSITVGRSGSVGEVNFVNQNFFWAHNTSLFLLKDYGNDINYLYSLLLCLDLKSYSAGSAVGSLNRNNIHEIYVATPSVPEQTAIANYLDRKTAEIDALIAQKQRLIELYQEEKTAIINQAVTKGMGVGVPLVGTLNNNGADQGNHKGLPLRDSGIDRLYQEEKTAIINQAVTQGIGSGVGVPLVGTLNNNGADRGNHKGLPLRDSGIDWLGQIPEGWDVKKLKYLGKIKYGLGQPPRQKNGGLPLIRATNIFRGKIDNSDLMYVDPEDVPYDRDPVLKENDIVVVRSGAYTGDSAIIPKSYEGAITGYDMVFRTNSFFNPVFISYCFLSNYVLYNQLLYHSLRAAQPHLNREELGETLIFLPKNIDEQTAIVHHIETETARIDAKIAKTQRIIELQKEYRTALISEVVTGKIKVTP